MKTEINIEPSVRFDCAPGKTSSEKAEIIARWHADNWLDGVDTDPNPDFVPDHASWTRVSGNREEAVKLAAALRAAERPAPNQHFIPEYTVTRNFEDGASIWVVTTSGPFPESGVHRAAWDAYHTSLSRDPLELAFELLEGFDYDG